MSIPLFESGDTLQFTWVSCVAPDGAPILGVVEPFSKTIIKSLVAVSSSALTYYTFVTMPTSTGIYLFTWIATKTIGSSAYPFIDRGLFKIDETKTEP